MRYIIVTSEAWGILLLIITLQLQSTFENEEINILYKHQSPISNTNYATTIIKRTPSNNNNKHDILTSTLNNELQNITSTHSDNKNITASLSPNSNNLTKNPTFSMIINNDKETNNLLNIITNNITRILNEYQKNHDGIQVPEKLWELSSSTKDYINQATQYVTPDNMTILKHTLDNLESYKQFMINKQFSQSPVISVTDIDNFNEFITNITKKGLHLRNDITTEITTNPFDGNQESILQIFNTLTDNNNHTSELTRENIDDLLVTENTTTDLTPTLSTLIIDTTTNENHTEEDFDQILLYYISSTWNNNNTRHDSITNENGCDIELPKPILKYNDTVEITDNFKDDNTTLILAREIERLQLKEIEDAAEYGLERMKYLFEDIEPKLYMKGLWLEKDNPAHFVAAFNAQQEKAKNLAKFGYASLQATTKLASQFTEPESRASSASAFEELTASLRQTSFHDLCPLRGPVQCSRASRKYRTADGTCNNIQEPRRGSALLPMQRFISPQYQDGIQSIRRSVVHDRPLPSAREISITVHGDRNIELTAITHMLMQWGQFIDHDVTQSAQSRGFNGSVPRCCLNGGQDFQPFENMHPDCLPITVPPFDWFLSPFGMRCMEFIRSAPASRFDCSLGWREQINQVTSYIDASNVYGSSVEQTDSLRTFHDGQLVYALTNPSSTDDEAERCNRGANSFQCFQSGDNRISEQPGLIAMGIVWIRQHNLIARKLSSENPQWSDEKTYQETRRIIIAMIQHITYREFLPIILGSEVMKLFDLQLLKTGYYEKYNSNVKPEIANSFSASAFRFGHSIVQHSFIRADRNHRLLTNNVTLHEERNNLENIWKPRSVDRVLLGMCNQPSQKRDEFISVELTNHLFQTSRFSFGMDLAAINIQRGRDHGLPSYTSWRAPCGLSSVLSWSDLNKIMSVETVNKLQTLYEHFDDIDLYTGGLSEKPVRGGLVGPTFACIIAQQFSNLRQGDRFWYENGNFESSFTLAQLQQIRKITLSQVLCSSMQDIETLQPFIFLTADNLRNERVSCLSPILNSFDLTPWVEIDDLNNNLPNDNSRTNVNLTEQELTSLENTEKLDINLLRENTDNDTLTTDKTDFNLRENTDNDTFTNETDTENNNEDPIMTNTTDALNLLLLSRNSLFSGELYKIEEAQLLLKSNGLTNRNNKKYQNFTTHIEYEIRPQLTTTTTKLGIDSKSNHGYGSEDWYDEFPKPSNLPYKKDKYHYTTTTSAYSLQTFQSVVANPTKSSRYTTARAPPSSSNPDLDEFDLHYDLKQKRPKPSDISYFIGVVDDKMTNKIKKNDYVQPTYGQSTQTYYEKHHHHHKPHKPSYNNKPQNTYYDNNRPNEQDYTTTTRRYDNYYPPLTTTKRYTIRPQYTYETNNYYPLTTTQTVYRPTTSRPRPIPTQKPLLPPQNGYNDDGYNNIRPITQRPNRPDNNYYGVSNNRPTRPETSYINNNRPSNTDGYYSTSNNRPIIVRPESDFTDLATESGFINININRPINNRPIRPENDFTDLTNNQPSRPTSRPIYVQNRPNNGYNQPTNNNDYYETSNSRPIQNQPTNDFYGGSNNRPISNRPTSNNDYYENSNNRPNEPGIIDLSNRPLSEIPPRPPQVDDEQLSFVYGQVSNPNYGRPTRPPNQYDYNNDPNFYGDRTDDKPRPIINYNEQPVKLFYIGNVLHKVKEGEEPTEVSASSSSSITGHNYNTRIKQTTFVKISSVSGHYNDKGTKNAYVNTKHNYQKENLDDGDLEIDESLHLYEALQEMNKSNKTTKNLQENIENLTKNSKNQE